MTSNGFGVVAFFALLLCACGNGPEEKVPPPSNNSIFVDAGAAADMAGNGGTGPDATTNSNQGNAPCIDVPSEVAFPETPVGDSVDLDLTVSNCGDTDVFVAPELIGSNDIELVAENEVRVAQGGSATFVLRFRPSQTGEQTVVLRYRLSGEPWTDQTQVRGIGSTDPDTCPTPNIRVRSQGQTDWESTLEVLPDTTIELDGSQSIGESELAVFDWTITARPQDSMAMLSDNAVVSPTVTLDLVGTYAFELTVEDDLGRQACESASVMIEVAASPFGSGLAIQLTWKTPLDQNLNDDDGTDLDLHFLHPNGQWNTPPWDIFWDNPTADWGPPGAVGDPEVTLDDTNGAGPENIILPQPENLTYSVGVYYYDDSSFGASYATVRVFFDGVIVEEMKDVFLAERQDFWFAYQIDWASRTVTSVDRTQRGFP